jgi:Cdc6-like AAA superfamily ATPase
VARNQPGTLLWVLQTAQYRHWIDSEASTSSGFLCISGDPGCGKTVISRFLLDNVQQSVNVRGTAVSPEDCRYPVLYFRLDDKYDTLKSAKSLLRALLHELIELVPDIICHAMPQYLSRGEKMLDSIETLWEVFCNAIRDSRFLSGVYVIIDALDECEEKSRQEILSRFKSYLTSNFEGPGLTNSTFLKLLATSRPYPEILSINCDRNSAFG